MLSSRMRLMRKLMSSSQTSANSSIIYNLASEHRSRWDSPESSSSEDDESSSNSVDGNIRVCTVCNTTKTPLWRTGPMGPKSLCNACGIRQMKARRAMDANSEDQLVHMKSSRQATRRNSRFIEEKSSSSARKLNKGFGQTSSTMKKKAHARFDEFNLMNSRKISAFHRPVLPQDEKEPAILLMALSYDTLVRS